MFASGLPNEWFKLCLGLLIMAAAPFFGRRLAQVVDPRSADAAAHRAQKAQHKAQQKYIAENREQIGFQYFKSTFLFAGHIAAADGTVCDSEKRLFDDFCARLQLDKAQIDAAQDYFHQGHNPDFSRTAAIDEFISQCGMVPSLCESFLQMQFAFVEASGTVIAAELGIIEMLSKRLQAESIYADALEEYRQSAALHAHASAKQRQQARQRDRDKQRFQAEKAKIEGKSNKQQGATLNPAQRELRLAFAILGLQPTKDKTAIKRAYRLQIKRHHPDYLLANGYPESLLAEATARSVKINQAYRLLKDRLKFR